MRGCQDSEKFYGVGLRNNLTPLSFHRLKKAKEGRKILGVDFPLFLKLSCLENVNTGTGVV